MQNIALKTTAFLAALSLFAGTNYASDLPVRITPGNQQTAGKIPGHAAADSTYQIDDGTSEGSLGIGISAYGYDICLNEFPVIPGSETITSVSINWGWLGFPQWGLDGTPYTIGIWSDPNGDGVPDDAVLLTTASDVIANSGTDTFVTTQITPTTIDTPDFFVGFVVYNGPPYYPCSVDESAPLANRSFYAAGIDSYDINNLTDNVVPIGTLEGYGISANFMIRADTSGSLALQGATSIKNGWSIDLPLDGSGVEDRSGGANNSLTLYLTFNEPLQSVTSATSSCGSVASVRLNPANAAQAELVINGATCNASSVTITLQGIQDTQGHSLNSASLSFGLLIGDVNGDRVVDRKDYQTVKQQMGQRVTAQNCRSDVVSSKNSRIDASDATMIAHMQNTRLP